MSDEKPLTLPRATAHDLKNQLGIVLGFLDLLIEDTPESDSRHADLLEARKAALACHAIVTASSDDAPR